MARWWNLERLLLLSVLICALTRYASAALSIRQGRIVPGTPVNVANFSVVGIATVELGGNPASRPTYFFDCITTRNNGSGIMWERMSTEHRFQVGDIPGDQLAGKRLNAGGIDYPDLDIYICSDRYSDDVISVNITAFNPAIMAAEETVGVLQGLTVELEVYVSGYPIPSSSQIMWYNPRGGEILDGDAGVQFQDGRRRLILSNVETQQAGLYECTVILSHDPYMGAMTYIQLDVYVPSAIETQPIVSTEVEEWTEVILNCSVSGSPMPMVTWEKEGQAQLPAGAVPSQNCSSSGNIVTSCLTFKRVRYEHRGRYRCVANNNIIVTPRAVSNYSTIGVSPVLRLEDAAMQPVNDLYFVEDQSSARLECFGSGNLLWNSSTRLEIPQGSSGNIYQSYDPINDVLSLVIRNFTRVTTSTYTCTTDLTDMQNKPITESVLVTSFNPAVIIQSRVQYVLAGTSTTLEAKVFASPPESAVVQWYHRGRLINDTTEAKYTATSSGDIHMLTVDSVTVDELGEYTIAVILNSVNATDRIVLEFPVPPTATISPSTISVTEGNSISITCEVGGSGPLTITWSMSDDSSLPMGVQENGNTLFIASAATTHSGTYVCSVSNLAGSVQAETTLTVFYGPTAVITYNNQTYTPDRPLYRIFDEKTQGPNILCSGSGNLAPTIRWIRENGRGLPSGIAQITQPNGDVLLIWQRPLEFTDSGSYHCQASNNIGNISASFEILVQIEPTINSIYPFNSVITQDSEETHTYTVPVNYIGRTLVCTAKGWPAPEVEWRKDNLHLPRDSGVVSESNAMSATVSARLTWTREFKDSDAGDYECVIHKPNTEVPLTSQIVRLNPGPPTPTPPPMPCSVDQQSIYFQIRVLGTSCDSWEGVQGEDIANELRSVVRTECGCTVDDSSLEVTGSAQCSSKVNGAAVFRGRIEARSQQDTESIFCTLFSWQQKTPLIRVNDQLRTVDTSCSLRASNSPNSEECAAPEDSSSFGPVEGAITGAFVGTAVLVLVVVLIIVSVYCYRRRTGSKDYSIDVEGTDHTYSRTESYTRYGPHSINTQEEPVYSTLTRGNTDVPQHMENIPLGKFPNDSSENLIPDGAIPEESAPRMKSAAAYQIPVSSQENLASPAPGSVNNFQAMKRQASTSTTTVGYHSTSHINRSSPIQKVPLPRPSNSSNEEGNNVMISATSPWNDYEHIDGDDAFSPSSSFCDSPISIPGKGRQQSSAGRMRTSPRSSQRQHGNAGMSASVPVGINPPQLGPTVFAVVEEDGDEFNTTATRVAASHQILNNGRPERNTTMQTRGVNDRGSHSPTGSTGSSSPHMMKQALMSQFQSVDHMTSRPTRVPGRESNCSEAPPPYTSRPSSEAVPNSDSADSSMMDNAAYGESHHRPWYQASDFSLDSSLPSTMSPASNNSTGEHIQPYAMIPNEHIPYPTHHKTSTTKLNSNESSAIIVRRSSNNSNQQQKQQKQKSTFQTQPPVQPYAEPIRSSVASLGHAQDSPTFFEVVV